MGFVTFFYLDDRPEDCRFLTTEEKAWLHDTLATEDRNMGKTDHGNPLAALLDGLDARVGAFALKRHDAALRVVEATLRVGVVAG